MKIKLTMLLAIGAFAGDLMSDPIVTIDTNLTYSGSGLTFSDQNITNEVNVFVKGASNSTLQLTDSTVSSNTLTNSVNNGGAFISATNVTLDNVDMYGNTVSASSGSNYGFVGGASITILNSEYSDNSVVDTNPSVNFAYGLVSHVSGSTKTLEVRDSTFDRNRIESSYSAGGVFSVMNGALANIYSSSFSENVAKGFDVEGRNAYSVTGSAIRVAGSATRLYVQDTAFLNNITTADAPSGEYGVYGAICNYDGTMTFKDCSFIGNSAQNQTGIYGGGGAIYHSGGTLNIEITKDATYTGNYVQDLSGAKLDSLGGFLYMDYPGEANFDVASGATLTIGNGTAGYDSIATQADVDGIVINKTGAGSLNVNSSMEYFTGALNVNQGEMNISNKLGASSVTIASDAVLKLSIGSEPVLTNENLTFSNAGTLALIAKGTESGKIAVASDLDFGNVTAYGGTFDSSSSIFTSGDNMEVSYGNLGGSSFDTAGTMKFSDGTSSLTIISQDAISFENNVRDDAVAADFFGADLLAAWTVTYDSTDTVVLSFEVNDDLSGASLYFQGDDGSWSKLNSWLDSDTINTITGESGNFALAIPEPSTYAAIFGVLAIAFAAYRRRK